MVPVPRTRTSAPRGSRRSLLGLRRRPGRLALAVFRLPVPLYRAGFGRLLGHTFLLLTHLGRRTGTPHAMAAMALGYRPDTREAVICSAWGPNADWVRNLRAGPAARVQIGRDSFTPQHRFLTDAEAFEVSVEFRGRHPRRLRFISRVLGWGDLSSDDAVRAFVATHPFVALGPTEENPSPT